jgi:hypothetical protein
LIIQAKWSKVRPERPVMLNISNGKGYFGSHSVDLNYHLLFQPNVWIIHENMKTRQKRQSRFFFSPKIQQKRYPTISKDKIWEFSSS